MKNKLIRTTQNPDLETKRYQDLITAGANKVFIDPSNVIAIGASTDAQSRSYVATQDCFVHCYMMPHAKKLWKISIDDVVVVYGYTGPDDVGYCYGVYLKKGQKLTISTDGTTFVSQSYKVFGLL